MPHDPAANPMSRPRPSPAVDTTFLNRCLGTLEHGTCKDVFRYASRYGLISADACERWLEYRDNRNETAHDYGKVFAEATLVLLPRFVADARVLADGLEVPRDA